MENIIIILNYFFQLDEGGRRGHRPNQKLSKKRFRLDVRKMFFLIELLIIGSMECAAGKLCQL